MGESVSKHNFNLLLWSAAHFKDQAFYQELLVQTSLLGFSIDLQTYLQCAVSVYENEGFDS